MAERIKTWRSGPPSGSPGREVLSDLYLDQKLSYKAIASRYGVSAKTIMQWIRAAGIAPRSFVEATPNKRPAEGVIQEMYVGRQMSYSAIAAELGLSVRSVARYVKERGIEPRSRSKGISLAMKGRTWTEAQRASQLETRQSSEYRARMAERFKGEKSPLWRGGKMDGETLRMQGHEWRQRRLECYERDNWTCQDCGVHCTSKDKQRIQAHHLVSRRLGGGDGLDNLVTLCASCHQRRERQ